MSEKIITLSMGGHEHTLDIGKFWFTKYYGQATKGDPLNATSILIDPENQFDFVVNMVYAGKRCYYKIKKIEEDFTKEDVQNWIGEKEVEEISSLINQYVELNKVKEPGENHVQTAGA